MPLPPRVHLGTNRANIAMQELKAGAAAVLQGQLECTYPPT